MKLEIKYGDFWRDEWSLFWGLQDPLVQAWFKEIKFMDWSEYQLWAHGGCLEERWTGDLDLTLIGPDRPDQVNFMLESMVAYGFHLGLRVDVKYLYHGELFDHQQWLLDHKFITNLYASYAPEITVDGKLFEYAELINGYWISQQTHPLKKVMRLDMPSPIQLI